VALKFLLHFVAICISHVPSDDHDRGGNDKRLAAAGMRANTLHHYWDTNSSTLGQIRNELPQR